MERGRTTVTGDVIDRSVQRPCPPAAVDRPSADRGPVTAAWVAGPFLPLAADGELTIYLAVGFLAGLAAIYLGAKQWRVGKLLGNTPTERIRSVAVGRTEIEGACRDVGTTVAEPYGDRDCVYRHWTVEEHHEGGAHSSDEWVTVASGTDVVPFFVEDDTGRILVDTTDAPYFEISAANAREVEVEAGLSPPDSIAAFHADKAMPNDGPGSPDGPRPRASGAGDAGVAEEPDSGSMSRQQVLDDHVDDMLLDDDGQLRPEVTAAQLQQELGDVPGVTVSDFFGGTTGDDPDAREEHGPDATDPVDTAAIVAELGGTGEAGDMGAGASLARRLVSGSLHAATGGGYGAAWNQPDTEARLTEIDADADRRYSQEVLPVDESVYVFGSAEPRSTTAAGANEELLKLGAEPATGQFIVSDRDEQGITDHYTNRGPQYVAGGLTVSTVCLAGLLWVFGIA